MLRAALQRAAILSNEKYRGVRLAVKPDLLTLQAHNPEQEEAEEEIEVDYKGEELEIGFNVNYLLDALAAVDDDQVELGLTDANSSCLVRAARRDAGQVRRDADAALSAAPRAPMCLTALDYRALPLHRTASISSFDPARNRSSSATNGSGKTSLLEAIYFWATAAPSARSQREKLLPPQAELPARRRPSRNDSRFAGRRRRVSRAGARAPTWLARASRASRSYRRDPAGPGHRARHPQTDRGRSARRRRLLDWGVFHVEHEFLGSGGATSGPSSSATPLLKPAATSS